MRCLGPNEIEEVMNEVHSRDCGSHLVAGDCLSN